MVEYKDRLQEAMLHAVVSIRDLSDAIGISYQGVRKVYRGESHAFSAENNAKAAPRGLFLCPNLQSLAPNLQSCAPKAKGPDAPTEAMTPTRTPPTHLPAF